MSVYHDKYVNESDGSLVKAKSVPGIAKDVTCMWEEEMTQSFIRAIKLV